MALLCTQNNNICIVEGCEGDELSFSFRNRYYELWSENLRLKDVTLRSRICRRHFKPECVLRGGRLRRGSVPTEALNHEPIHQNSFSVWQQQSSFGTAEEAAPFSHPEGLIMDDIIEFDPSEGVLYADQETYYTSYEQMLRNRDQEMEEQVADNQKLEVEVLHKRISDLESALRISEQENEDLRKTVLTFGAMESEKIACRNDEKIQETITALQRFEQENRLLKKSQVKFEKENILLRTTIEELKKQTKTFKRLEEDNRILKKYLEPFKLIEDDNLFLKKSLFKTQKTIESLQEFRRECKKLKEQIESLKKEVLDMKRERSGLEKALRDPTMQRNLQALSQSISQTLPPNERQAYKRQMFLVLRQLKKSSSGGAFLKFFKPLLRIN